MKTKALISCVIVKSRFSHGASHVIVEVIVGSANIFCWSCCESLVFQIMKKKFQNVMHQSLVTTTGQGIAVEMLCFYFCIVSAVQGKCQGFVI